MSKDIYEDIIILPAPNCRRSKKILDFLDKESIPYKRIDLLSPRGQELTQQYNFLASPGILVNGENLNPYDILEQKQCRVNRGQAFKKFQESKK